MTKQYRVVNQGNISHIREVTVDEFNQVIAINPLSNQMQNDWDELVKCQQQSAELPSIRIQQG